MSTTSVSSVKPIRRANRLLAKGVRHVLTMVKGLDSGNIVVVARSGAVTLAGSVPNASQIELATTAAKSIEGVASMKEKMIIRTPRQ